MSDASLSPSSGMLSNLSIVVPIAPGDDSWQLCIADLAAARTEAEVLLVGAQTEPDEVRQLRNGDRPIDMRWLETPVGRARQLNCGARHSTRPFVWFLHADSRVDAEAFLALRRALVSHPQALHYFDLAFQDDGPRLVGLNALGARVRSRCMGLPFGDQGLCMSRETFERLGGFDETAAYGEDHLLVWAAHRCGVPLHRVEAFITTSARKYSAEGWLATTMIHGWRTWRQAIPQFVRLMWIRCQ